MVKLFKYKNGEIKIMWNAKPMLKDHEYSWYSNQIETKTYQFSSSFLLGVELKVHKGGRICYGMLMAQVQPYDKQNCVDISLAYTHKNTVKYEGSCLYNDTYVYKGLPEEYVGQVINSISSSILKKDSYPQCSITLEESVNCEVGSSPIIFGIIADIITNIICTSSEDEILDMNIETFTKQYVKNISLQY